MTFILRLGLAFAAQLYSVARSNFAVLIVLSYLMVSIVSACTARAAGAARYQAATGSEQPTVVVDASQQGLIPIPPFSGPRLLPSTAVIISSVIMDSNLEPQVTAVSTASAGQANSPLATPSHATSATITPTTTTLAQASTQEKLDETASLYLASVANAADSTPVVAATVQPEPTPIVVVMPTASLLPTPTATPVITNPPVEQAPVTDEQPISEETVVAALTQPLLQPTPAPLRPSTVQPVADGIERSVRVPILMYHYLSEPTAGADIYRVDLSVAPAQFAAHLDAIQENGYTTVSLYDLVAHLLEGNPLPEKPVILTFDDGYRDNYENALPILRDHNMQATFFVVTDFIDEERPGYITWDMVREMYAAGMSIESHGRNHVSLRNKDRDYLIWQALGSLETIQFEIGVRPRFISYPAGDYDMTTIEVFESANYWAGLTTIQGATHSNQDLFQLHRVRIRNSTTNDELLRLLALDW